MVARGGIGLSGEGESPLHCLGMGTALQGQLGKRRGTWPHVKALGKRSLSAEIRISYPDHKYRVTLNLLLPLGKRAGDCSLEGW